MAHSSWGSKVKVVGQTYVVGPTSIEGFLRFGQHILNFVLYNAVQTMSYYLGSLSLVDKRLPVFNLCDNSTISQMI